MGDIIENTESLTDSYLYLYHISRKTSFFTPKIIRKNILDYQDPCNVIPESSNFNGGCTANKSLI